MATPQMGIFREGCRFHHYLECTVSDRFGAPEVGAVRAAAVGQGGVDSVIAFGDSFWRRLAGERVPAALAPFDSPADGVPATQRDLLLWLQGDDPDDVIDAAIAAARAAVSGGATLELDLRGFVYRDSRDLIGFVDGSANPRDGARMEVALLPEGDDGTNIGAGGAFVLTQQWRHDLDSFHALEVSEQEKVIGRTKADSIEFSDAEMPEDAHVARTDFKLDGETLRLYRRSTSWGAAGEKGLYFVAFACDIIRFPVLLRRMFGSWEDGLHDRLTGFSTPITGSFWFAPSREDIEAAGCAG